MDKEEPTLVKSDIDEFVTHPCWVKIRMRLKTQQEGLFNQILNNPLEEIDPLRIEYKKIAVLLDYPRVFREELEEEEE